MRNRPWLIAGVALAVLLILVAAGRQAAGYLRVGTAYAAKMACSGVFVSGLPPADVVAAIPVDDLRSLRRIRLDVDTAAGVVTASALGIVRRRARHRHGFGCALGAVPQSSRGTTPRTGAVELPTSPPDSAIATAIERGFTEPDPQRLKRTQAIVVMQAGRIVGERYADGIDAETPLLGWSMTKSVLNALVGILVGDGRLSLEAPAPVPAWQEPEDPRQAITLDDLIRMSSGLRFEETYDGADSDVLRMLFESRDAAGYAAALELEARPGTRWRYSSGTSNIIAAAIRTVFDDTSAYHAFPKEALFDRIGMNSAVLETDASGTFVASSFMYASARDWARFGMLYLADGVWNGARILPDGWVSYSTSAAPANREGRFGAHFWLRVPDDYCPSGEELPLDAYHAIGHEAQFITVVPSRSAVIVRLGRSRYANTWDHCAFVSAVLAAMLPREHASHGRGAAGVASAVSASERAGE